jgi:hypothetical protein
MPDGAVSKLNPVPVPVSLMFLKLPVKAAVEISHAVPRRYSYRASPAFPTIHIYFPSDENDIDMGVVSCVPTTNETESYDAVAIFHAVAIEYA